MKNKYETNQGNASGHLLYVTSDQHVFFDEQAATRHARRLCDTTVRHLTRDEAEQQANYNAGPADELETFLDELTGN